MRVCCGPVEVRVWNDKECCFGSDVNDLLGLMYIYNEIMITLIELQHAPHIRLVRFSTSPIAGFRLGWNELPLGESAEDLV